MRSKARNANGLNGSDWLKNSFSIWRDLKRDTDINGAHPATFPVSLAARLIDCFAADPKGTVLDPFAGSGSTLLAALRAGMPTIGFDINPAYRTLFKGRFTLFESTDIEWRYEIADARTLTNVLPPNSVEIAITSPPYWDILNRKRSADRKDAVAYSKQNCDLGNIEDYATFLDALNDVVRQVEIVLRPGGYFIINVMDIRKGPVFYPLHHDVSESVNKHMVLNDIIIWDRQAEYNSMRPLGYPYKFIINKVHEYLLIFRKQ